MLRSALALALVLVPTFALAQRPSVRVTRFDRDRGRQDERAVTRALRDDGYEVGPNGDVIVRGEVDGNELTLRVRIRGRTETITATGDSPRERGRSAATAIGERLGGASAEAAPAPSEEDEPTEEGEPEPVERAEAREPEEETERASAARRSGADVALPEPERSALSAFSMELSGGVLRRRLAFRDDLFGTVSNYGLAAAPVVGLSASWFPGAHGSTSHPLAGIGLVGDFRAMFGVSSESSTGEVYDTRSLAASVDAAYRHPLGEHAFGGRVGYGTETFFVDSATPASPEGRNAPRVPRTFYRMVRVHADADVHLAGPLRFVSYAGLRILTHTGELDDWFPGHRRMGFSLGLAFALAFDVATLRLYMDYARYAFDFDPEPGDADVVGGASDDWLVFGLSVGVRVRGAP